MISDTRAVTNSQLELSHSGYTTNGILARSYEVLGTASYAFLRIAFGLILVTHGLPKVFGGGHGSLADPKASATNFIRTVLHFPAPEFFADFVTILETGGAIMLALGLLTRVIAPMIAFEMAMICIILSPHWVWLDHGMEYAMLMGFVALMFAARGAGPLSLDHWLGSRIRAARLR
jgi:putative oxidoreductase